MIKKKSKRCLTTRALTPEEGKILLNTANYLLVNGQLSKDNNRYNINNKPQRKNYRPYRNLAILHCLISGLRINEVTQLRLDQINFNKSLICISKNRSINMLNELKISSQTLLSINEYIEKERMNDADYWHDPKTLFLSAKNSRGQGNLSTRMIHNIWSAICEEASIKGTTPHSARLCLTTLLNERNNDISTIFSSLASSSKKI